MGWNTNNFSYTQGQIGSTAFNAGCGNGWFWIHTGSPHMFIKGSVNDGGSYSFKFFKPNYSHFGYYLKIYACGVLIFDLTSRDLDNKKCEKTVEGTFSEAQYNADNTLYAYCQANEGCVASVAMTGVTFYKAPSSPYVSIDSTGTNNIKYTPSWTKGNQGGDIATVYLTTINPVIAYNSGTSYKDKVQKCWVSARDNALQSKTVSTGTQYEFSGLSPNTTYYVTVYYSDQYNTDTNDNHAIIYTAAKATLKAVSDAKLEEVSKTTKTITVKPSWVLNNSKSATATITCNGVSKTTSTSGSSVKFTGLTPNTSYTISVTITDDESNSISTTLDVTTHTAPTGLKVSLTATGKTITPTISWTASSWSGNSYTLKVYYAKSKTASASSTLFGTYSSITYNTTSKSVTISDLINGTYYAVYAKLTDKESNITSNSSNVETYKVVITSIDSSTKALKFSIAITNGAKKSLQKVYKISGGNAPGTDTNYSSTVIKDNLNHNTSYTISSWISGMSDTLTSITMSTKLFSVNNISSSTGLHNITTEWQAKANGDNYDSDNITGSLVVFGSCSNTGYKHDDDATNLFTYTTPTTNGNISGDYQTNHTLYSTALNYWAWYTITCSVTDGHNTVQSTINLCTQFPYSRMYIGGKWVKVMPYIYTNNKWINSPVHINSNSAWRESDCF